MSKNMTSLCEEETVRMTNDFVRYEKTLLKLAHQRFVACIQGRSSLYPVTYS
jgi:hypothetical protein